MEITVREMQCFSIPLEVLPPPLISMQTITHKLHQASLHNMTGFTFRGKMLQNTAMQIEIIT